MVQKNITLQQRYNRIRNRAYFRLGAQQLMQRPILNILTVMITAFGIILWRLKEPFLKLLSPPELLSDIINILVPVLFITIPFLTFFALLKSLGKHVANNIENNLPILFGDDEPYPVLLSYKKTGKLVCMEFFSDRVTTESWENPEAFKKCFRGQLESIRYSSKPRHRDNRFIIWFYQGLSKPEEKDLVDTPFPSDSGI